MRRIRRHLTFANVVSLIALSVALGGTTYAATGGNFILGQSNSASSTTSLTRTAPNTGASKGLQVTNLGAGAGATALGLNVAGGHAPFTVNSGTKVANLNADKLDGLDSTAFARNGSAAWREVGAPNQPGFNGPPPGGICAWSNYDSGANHNSVAFLRDRHGFVHLKGLAKTTCNFTVAPEYADIFNLPAGYRPAKREIHAVLTSNALGRVSVDGPSLDANLGAGAVLVDAPTTPANASDWVSLDGISFRCAPSGSDGCP